MRFKLFSIQEVSNKVNVPKSTLRYWEKEFHGILVPTRTEGGQRRYEVEHLVILEEIKSLKKKGESIAEIRNKLHRDYQMKVGGSDSETIDRLAKQIAEILRDEIFSYFKENDTDHNAQEVTKP